MAITKEELLYLRRLKIFGVHSLDDASLVAMPDDSRQELARICETKLKQRKTKSWEK